MIGVERISNDTRLVDLTVGELKELFQSFIPPEDKYVEEKKYAYGLDGIAEAFRISKSSAYRLKRSGKIDKAIIQEGQKIIMDIPLAFQLLKKK